MNFQGLHRTIQFSISSLALGKRQKHNISQIFYFANRFLNFFRFFSKPKFFKNLRSAKFRVLYQPRCVVVFDAQQKHNISHFFNFANRFLKIFWIFSLLYLLYIHTHCKIVSFRWKFFDFYAFSGTKKQPVTFGQKSTKNKWFCLLLCIILIKKQMIYAQNIA